MEEEVMNPLFEEFYRQLLLFVPKALSGLLIFFAFWLGAFILQTFILRSGRKTHIEPSLIQLLGHTAQILIIIVGAVTALGTMGVNVGALIAGLGLSSFALSFALKDALSNLLAGVSILLYRPFQVGDQIEVTGLQGVVIAIDLRYTTLSGGDRKILVPNSNLFINSVIVLNRQYREAKAA